MTTPYGFSSQTDLAKDAPAKGATKALAQLTPPAIATTAA